jgi:hypothetical protein
MSVKKEVAKKMKVKAHKCVQKGEDDRCVICKKAM